MKVTKARRRGSAKRHVVVVTGSRAGFGILLPVMRAIAAHRRLRLSAVVSGLHLVQNTWRDVKRAGFEIAARVPVQKRGQTGRSADVAALGRGVPAFGGVFDQLQPDVVLVLGDRVEIFAAAAAAQIGGYRLAHIHGGDRAEGVADEAMRHAISKLAHLHFAASARSRRRLIRMGEHAAHVFNVGSPAVDGLREIVPAGDAPQLIVMQHPVGGTDAEECRWMKATLSATRRYDRLVFAPNADPGRTGIDHALAQTKTWIVDHLPRQRFLELLVGAGVIVGNSSAGLIEAAVLKTPCVNIGPRQNGREKPGNVIDCAYGVQNVRRAVACALKMNTAKLRHPYGVGQTGERIAQILADIDLRPVPVKKRNSY